MTRKSKIVVTRSETGRFLQLCHTYLPMILITIRAFWALITAIFRTQNEATWWTKLEVWRKETWRGHTTCWMNQNDIERTMLFKFVYKKNKYRGVHQMRLLHRRSLYHCLECPWMTFHTQKEPYLALENNWGRTDRPTDGRTDWRTDGHDLL